MTKTEEIVKTDLKFMGIAPTKDGDILNILIPKKRKRHEPYFTQDIKDMLKGIYECRKVRVDIIEEGLEEEALEDIKREVVGIDVQIISDNKELILLQNKFERSKLMAIDFETDSVDAKNANIISMGVSFDDEKTYYVSIAHNGQNNVSLEEVKTFLLNAAAHQIKFLVWNLSFERKLLQRLGVHIDDLYVDVMIYNYLAADYPRMGLKDVALKRLGVFMKKFDDIVGTGKKAIPFADVDLDVAAQYCGSDALYTLQLYKHFQENYEIKNELIELDHEAALTCCDMESAGAPLDFDHFKKIEGWCETRKDRLEKIMYKIAGKEFNLSSPKQTVGVLYTDLGIEPRKWCYNDKNNLSTSADVVERLIEDGEDNKILKHLSQYRNMKKLLTNYLKMPEKVDSITNRFHPYFNFVGTATGRLSSDIQQLPKSGIGAQIRAGIVAPKGYKIVAADYAQIEFRIFAHILGQEDLIQSIKDGHDIHKATAAVIFDKHIDDVTGEERSAAKTIVFGLLYGQKENKTAATLNISVEEARELAETYFSAFPEAKLLMERSVAAARKKGYAETLFGRRRYLPGLRSRKWGVKNEAERQCFNTVIQGTAADIIRKSMAVCNLKLCKEVYAREAKLIFQVHDELVFLVKEESVEEFSKELDRCMSSVVDFAVPLKVDINYGDNYLEAK